MNTQIVELGKQFKALSVKHDEATKALKELSKEWDELEAKLMEALIEEGVKSVVIEGIGRITLVSKSHLSVNVANKPQMFAYMKDVGAGDLLKLDCAPQTLSKWLGEHLEELQKHEMESGLDEVEAREKALGQLKAEGASFFVQRRISLTKGE